MQRLLRRNSAALQDIDLGGGTDVTGRILSEDDHKTANTNQVFDQADGALEAYDPSIQDDENNAVHLRQEKPGPTSLIAMRPSKPPIVWGRNSSSHAWKKSGWFA